MSEQYGGDYITLTDEEGKELEMEILDVVEYRGATYYALCPADSEGDEIEVGILKQVTEDGEDILVTIDDDAELEAVYELLFGDEEEDEDEEEKK
ncbi:MAG: DUF1292 domain-containing protein [Oscillospiraceae bacterium]|nr:DUF1292 domain-containing protein [Oscillospiraceae bacterium]